jgi:hypothetical protein
MTEAQYTIGQKASELARCHRIEMQHENPYYAFGLGMIFTGNLLVEQKDVNRVASYPPQNIDRRGSNVSEEITEDNRIIPEVRRPTLWVVRRVLASKERRGKRPDSDTLLVRTADLNQRRRTGDPSVIIFSRKVKAN